MIRIEIVTIISRCRNNIIRLKCIDQLVTFLIHILWIGITCVPNIKLYAFSSYRICSRLILKHIGKASPHTNRISFFLNIFDHIIRELSETVFLTIILICSDMYRHALIKHIFIQIFIPYALNESQRLRVFCIWKIELLARSLWSISLKHQVRTNFCKCSWMSRCIKLRNNVDSHRAAIKDKLSELCFRIMHIFICQIRFILPAIAVFLNVRLQTETCVCFFSRFFCCCEIFIEDKVIIQMNMESIHLIISHFLRNVF